jgi:hypothetical protein
VDGNFIYVAGFDEAPGPGDFEWRIERRFASNGALDREVAANPTAGDDRPRAIAVLRESIVIAGDQEVAPGDFAWRIEKRWR